MPSPDTHNSDRQAVRFGFDNTYARLPERFYALVNPTPVATPRLVKLNLELARSLQLNPQELASEQGVQILAGNQVAAGSEPRALAYAGHQFGYFVPQLGDGRANLLGEVIGSDGVRYDIQLKGSGPTPFSRRGDGRAALGPVLREYIVSEAMATLGVPTTRALAAITTGEEVFRESVFPGAVLTRVAASHLRVGTFQYFAAQGDTEAIRSLADYAIARHYPEAAGEKRPYRAFLDGVIARQAHLVAQWILFGFIHGVMNTDNTSISGETIDYGPCAFMEAYEPDKVFSSIDHQGRYAYSNQPHAALWNLARLAETLLPILQLEEGSESTAIASANQALAAFDPTFAAARTAGIKLGVVSQRRWYEPVLRMKEAIDAGKLGKPVLAIVTMLGWREPAYYLSDPWRGTWAGEGGGVVVSQAPHYLDLMSWFMGPAVELHGYWDTYNHPGIEVDDTVVASVRFKNGGMGSIVLSNSQRPGLWGKIHIHGSSGASVGAETDSGSPFISGVTEKMDPPFNDIWTVPGEENNLAAWNRDDRSRTWNVMTHYHQVQLADFLGAVIEDREPMVDAEAGRRVVELFTAVYRSQREHAPQKLPLLR